MECVNTREHVGCLCLPCPSDVDLARSLHLSCTASYLSDIHCLLMVHLRVALSQMIYDYEFNYNPSGTTYRV